MQKAGLGGEKEVIRQDFPTSPADSKWRTNGSVDADRRPRHRERRETAGRDLKGSTLGPLVQHRCRLLRPFSLALVGVMVNLHPAILNWDRLQGDHAWDAGRGRGRSPPRCLIDLLAHHLLFPLNTRLQFIRHPSNIFFHYFFSIYLIYSFTLFCDLFIYSIHQSIYL